MSRSRRTRVAFGLASASLAALGALALVVRSVEPFGVDQGLFACFARWVPRGWLPYRDLFDSKPPLFLYTWALSSLAPGDPIQAAWLLEAIWLSLTAGLAARLAARVWDRWVGLAAAGLLVAGLFAPGWGGYAARMQAEELLALPLLGAAWLAWAALDRERLAFACGVLTGVVGLYKIPALAVAAAWPVTWLLDGGARAGSRRTAAMTIGLALPWGLAAGWFAAHGAWRPFVEGVLVYQRHFAAYVAPPWWQVLGGFARELVTNAGLLLGLATVGVAGLVRRRAREARWLAPWIVATFAAVVLQRQLAGYHFLLVVPGLAVAGAFGLVAIVRGLAEKKPARLLPAALGAAAVLALGVKDAVAFGEAWALDARARFGALDRDAYLGQLQRDGYAVRDEEVAARYVATRTRAADGVLVWGLSPGLYALADRHPATRFPFHKVLLTDAPLSRAIPGLEERRRALLDRLRDDPPAYVLVGRGDANGFEPEPSNESLARFEPLRSLVERDYRLETEIGHFLVYRRAAVP